jgi:competence protein ComGC
MGRAITHMQVIKRNQKKKGFTTAIMMCCLSILVLSAIIIVPPSLSFQSQTNGGSKYPTMSSNQRAPYDLQPNNTTTILGLPSSDKITELKLLADSLSDRLNKSAAILEITSKLPEVKSAPYSNLISPKLHGIPKNVDISKRKVAQSILSVDKDFRVIFFLMPNGDIYLNEPYLLQANLTNNNFAYRGYYKGAINTHDTYLGNVVISNSSGFPTSHISVPIYSSALTGNNDNSTIAGIWAGGLNLKVLSKYLQSLNLASDERILYVDQYGHKIADSDKILSDNYNESFANLQAFKNAIAGKSGSTIEAVNGTKKTIQYQPVKFHSTTWAVLLMEQLT